jgi:uncharacterized protein (DUF362 family)
VWIGDAGSASGFELAAAAGYRERIPNFDDVWVDLSADDVTPVEGFLNQSTVYVPETAAKADLVISLGKLRTDGHYELSGAITNLFGLLSSGVYGHPEGMHSLVTATAASELVRVFRRSFAVVDAIVGVDGSGDVKQAGVLDPKKIDYLRLSAAHGVVAQSGIEQTGERIEDVRTKFPRASA